MMKIAPMRDITQANLNIRLGQKQTLKQVPACPFPEKKTSWGPL
jgi:hypothetical protein